ncbi:MAG TPA: glycoside hydrolase family 3 N-terminal domain-containing protein [Polyangiaceae bacterium]|nr:glycoside hydrolase family 3 N-terminal domain-containing protein [Polyangiaceae bacterium]
MLGVISISNRPSARLAVVGPLLVALASACADAGNGGGAGTSGAGSSGSAGANGGVAASAGMSGTAGAVAGAGMSGTAGAMAGAGMSGTGGAIGGAGTGGAGGKSIGGTGGVSTAGSGGFVYPAPVAPWQPSQACIDQAAQILAGMTLRQKAGQMVQADSAGIEASAVATYAFGSVFSGGSSDPPTDDLPATWRAFVESFEAEATSSGIPLLYGIDAVHGNNNVSNAVIFPHNIGLGATRDFALVTEVAHITALETRGTSIDWTFAPAISPAQDERWGRTVESYSEVPALAAEMGVATLKGLQGDSLAAPGSVLACAKHFAGDGATQGGVDKSDVVLDEAAFRTLGVQVYQPLINAGVASIMVSYSSYNGVKMTGNAHWLTDVLKGEMGFRGIVGSDWAASSKLPGDAATQVATAVNAGVDMLMEPYQAAQDVDLLEAAPAASGSALIPMARIDDAVTRILTIKCEHGMLAPGYDPSGDAALLAEIGSPAHRDVARKAVRESAVLLRNENHALPLPETAHVHVAGSGADSLQRQCGGWTVDWQGLGTESKSPGSSTGTTILKGVEAIAGSANVTFSLDGSAIPEGTTHVIVVLSEAPYAEELGDVTDLDLATRTSDVPVLQAARSSGLPVIAVLLSGRPLIIEPYLDQADAWVAAWFPGSEADALADVLFGRHPPTGKLGHTWPRTMAQIPVNFGDVDYETDPPLFPFGHGLSY